MVERVRRNRPAVTEQTHDTVLNVMSSSFGIEENERTVIGVRKFATEPAYVRVNAGTTKNLGNYESLRVDVSITLPCYAEEIPTVFEKVADEVAGLLADELKKYES
jgi:hypothetical protein